MTDLASPADVFTALDAKLTDLTGRRDVAREQLDELRTAIEKERTVYRTALARAEIDGVDAPSRDVLEAKERELVITEDRLAGLEGALAELTPSWRSAKIAMLRERELAFHEEAQRIQAGIHARALEIRALQDLDGQDGARIQALIGQRQKVEHEIQALRRA